MGKILTLLAILLALANARCFVRCQLDSADRTAPPCHSQSKITSDHCIEQHDASAAPAVPQTVIAAVAASPEIVFTSLPFLSSRAPSASPPSSAITRSRPLRI